MSGEPQLFRVNPGSTESERIEEVDFSQLGLRERQDIQEWVAANPSILGDDLLIIDKEFSGFDRTNERLDLLAVDPEGTLVIIELKRDDTGADAHWQAIKYASYFRRASYSKIVEMFAAFKGIPPEAAEDRLLEHLEDSNALNKGQRIILASHRFSPEVMTAVVWLNEKAKNDNLVTCVALTPYRDGQTGSLYLQSSTVIPSPGVEEDLVGLGDRSTGLRNGIGSLGEKLKVSMEKNRNDEVTEFTVRVHELTRERWPDKLSPEHRGRWTRGDARRRWCNFWYGRLPWANHRLCYRLDLRPQTPDTWRAGLWIRDRDGFALPILKDERLHDNQTAYRNGIYFEVGVGALDDVFAGTIADTFRAFIERVTPLVDEIHAEGNLQAVDVEPDDDEKEEIET